MTKETVPAPSRTTHRDQEWYDAEIARKLQEEELLVSKVEGKSLDILMGIVFRVCEFSPS